MRLRECVCEGAARRVRTHLTKDERLHAIMMRKHGIERRVSLMLHGSSFGWAAHDGCFLNRFSENEALAAEWSLTGPSVPDCSPAWSAGVSKQRMKYCHVSPSITPQRRGKRSRKEKKQRDEVVRICTVLIVNRFFVQPQITWISKSARNRMGGAPFYLLAVKQFFHWFECNQCFEMYEL